MEEIMKNTIRRGLCLLLLLAMTAAMAACGQKNANTNTDEKTMVYAVEAGSAGEEVAMEKGWTVNSVQDQAAALMEVAAGTSDAAVIDLLMAGAMIGPDTSYPDLTYTDSLTQEEYGIGCRQGQRHRSRAAVGRCRHPQDPAGAAAPPGTSAESGRHGGGHRLPAVLRL